MSAPLTSAQAVVRAAMGLARDAAEGQLDAGALDADLIAQCCALVGLVVGPSDPLWSLQLECAGKSSQPVACRSPSWPNGARCSKRARTRQRLWNRSALRGQARRTPDRSPQRHTAAKTVASSAAAAPRLSRITLRHRALHRHW